MESRKHKALKNWVANLLENGKTGCLIRQGHRADACNEDIAIEVNCKRAGKNRICNVEFYDIKCQKIKNKINCEPFLKLRF